MALQSKLTEFELAELKMKIEIDEMKKDRKRAKFIEDFNALSESEKARVIFDLLQRLEKVEEYIKTQKSSSHEMIY